MYTVKARETLEQRFHRKAIDNGPDECWGWRGGKTVMGYGNIHTPGTKQRRNAHRVSYEIHYGPIPDGAHICHTCDNPICTNPNHLYVGDAHTNGADKRERGRANPRKLTRPEVLELRRLYSEGTSADELGEIFSVHPYTAYRAAVGVTWKDI